MVGMLGQEKIMAFAATTDPERAKAFYSKLGLRFVSHDQFAVVFDSNGIELRVTLVKEVALAPYTVLGWEVTDIASRCREMTEAGVVFERYPFLQQDKQGIWTAPGGAKVAW